MLSVSACANAGSGTNYCAIAEPIYISKQDVLTDTTAREILVHNEVGASLCGW